MWSTRPAHTNHRQSRPGDACDELRFLLSGERFAALILAATSRYQTSGQLIRSLIGRYLAGQREHRDTDYKWGRFRGEPL